MGNYSWLGTSRYGHTHSQCGPFHHVTCCHISDQVGDRAGEMQPSDQALKQR